MSWRSPQGIRKKLFAARGTGSEVVVVVGTALITLPDRGPLPGIIAI